MKTDIEYDQDVVRLVDAFYGRLLEDDSISYIFKKHMRLSLEKHLPIMYDFWQSILLDKQSYRGNVMIKHIELNRLTALTDQNFSTWLSWWEQTIDTLFAGPVAETAKQKAQTMAALMQYKIKSSHDSNFIQ